MSRKGRHLFTSESVTEGHPDKIADQISDAILDAILAQDPMGRVACETLVTTGLAIIAGEITTNCYVDFPEDRPRDDQGRRVHARASSASTPRPAPCCRRFTSQSPDIAQGVDPGGAGDQGLMFGYACTETEELMPLPIMLAHKLVEGSVVRAARRRPRLPPARRQVPGHRRIRRRQAGPRRHRRGLHAAQRRASRNDTLRDDITEKIVNRVIPAEHDGQEHAAS